MRRLPLDFHACAFGTRQGMEFFHPHAGGFHAGVVEAGLRDAFGQRFGEVDVARCHERADFLFDGCVVDHFFQPVVHLDHIFHRQIDIDAHGLQLALFVAVDADLGEHSRLRMNTWRMPRAASAMRRGWTLGSLVMVIPYRARRLSAR